jgi:argininosuccinate lyase
MLDSWVYATGVTVPLAIRELGHSYVLVTPDPTRFSRNPVGDGPHPVIAEAEAVLVADINDEASLLSLARSLHAEQPFAGVITSCDHYLVSAARVAEELGLPTVGSRVVKTVRDKYCMRAASAAAGLATPAFAIASTVEEAVAAGARIGYPVVVKPTDMSASAFVALARNEAELSEAAQQIIRYDHNARGQALNAVALIEEFLDGDEVSVETVSVDGDTRVIAVTDKSLYSDTLFIETGHMVPATLDEDVLADVHATVRSTLEALGYTHGIAHTEVKLTSRGVRIVEINPRVGGNWISELVLLVTGFDLIKAFVRLCLGSAEVYGPVDAAVAKSAAIQFLLPSVAGTLDDIGNWDEVVSSDGVWRSFLSPGLRGRKVNLPTNNDSYLGHIVCVDTQGFGARNKSEGLVSALELAYLDVG